MAPHRAAGVRLVRRRSPGRRLTRMPRTPALARAELRSQAELGKRLGVRAPPAWPPPLSDRRATEDVLVFLAGDPHQAEWPVYQSSCATNP